jgi:hypothetical protein
MNIVIATTTAYPSGAENSLRADLALQFIKKCIEKQYPLVVVDNSSSESFLQQLKDIFPSYLSQTTPGFGKGKREAIAKAVKQADIIVLTEPEKISLLNFIQEITEPIQNNSADLVIPRRKSVTSYPLFQQKTEQLLNEVWRNITKTDLDISIGPRVFRKDIAEFFLDYNGKFGDRWESIFLPVIDAIRAKKRVKDVEIEYLHPAEQTAQEEGNIEFDLKRLDQLNSLSHAINTYWNI